MEQKLRMIHFEKRLSIGKVFSGHVEIELHVCMIVFMKYFR